MTAKEMRVSERLTPRRAIRAHCIDCVGSVRALQHCGGDRLYDGPCALMPYRLGRGRPSARLIRKFCIECMGGHTNLVRDCPSRTFPFLPYRMGKNPARMARKQTEKQRQSLLAGRMASKWTDCVEERSETLI